MKKVIATNNAPAAIGPYSQAVQVGNLVFVSGQLPADPQTGNIDGTTIQEQTKQSLTNVKNILEAAGSSMDDVVKATCYMQHMSDFAAMNEVYNTFFSEGNYPALAAFEVAALPKGALIEIEVVAEVK